MSEITEITVFRVGAAQFDTRDAAVTHIRRTKSHGTLMHELADSGIYFRDTTADEIATWIVDNYERIRQIVEGGA
jgi:hypothetical protein